MILEANARMPGQLTSAQVSRLAGFQHWSSMKVHARADSIPTQSRPSTDPVPKSKMGHRPGYPCQILAGREWLEHSTRVRMNRLFLKKGAFVAVLPLGQMTPLCGMRLPPCFQSLWAFQKNALTRIRLGRLTRAWRGTPGYAATVSTDDLKLE